MRAFLLCLFLSAQFAFSQNKIIGFVKDAVTNKPLPFATILINNSISVITDAEGKFEVTLTNETKNVKVSYSGFESQSVSLTPQTGFYQIGLVPGNALNEVTVFGEDKRSRRIMEKAVALRHQNNSEKRVRDYSYRAYEKILVTADLDTVSSLQDSIRKLQSAGEDLTGSDSLDINLLRQLSSSHLYLSEKISDQFYNEKTGQTEKIVAHRMGGFTEPVYEVLAVDLQTKNWYKDRLLLLGTEFSNPLSSPGLQRYNYKITDTISEEGRGIYVMDFYPKDYQKPGNLKGTLFLDTITLGLQRTIIQAAGNNGIDIKATQDFRWLDSIQVWFPADKELVIRQSNQAARIEALGGDLSLMPQTEEGKIKNISEVVYFLADYTVENLQINQGITKVKSNGSDVVYASDAHLLNPKQWDSLRPQPATQRDLNTYRMLDSLVAAQKIEKKINLGRKLLAGWYPTKYVDWDLRTLIKYNSFEGFRTGLGFVTNEAFSDKFRLDGYGVYGFKDTSLKYSFGGAYKIAPATQTWVGVSWVDDLQEVGNSTFLTDQRIFSLFEPRLFNIELFYDTQILNLYAEHNLSASLFTKFQISRGNYFTKFDYTFLNDGQSFSFYNLGTASWSFQYNPFSRFVSTHKGLKEVKQGFPKFSLQLTKSIDGFLSGDFNFFKTEGRVLHEWKHLNKTKTTFLLEAAWADGDIPVTHLYHMSPNNPNDDRLMGRFSVAGRNSFETMFFGEFFSDRFAALHIKHQFNPFNWGRKFRPELLLISRAAVGDVSNVNKHNGITFKSIEDGFYESGFEFNKLFKGFGLSLFYRYGPNSLPTFEDNLSFKFTYYFSFNL